MKKIGNKNCDWCDGYGAAFSTVDKKYGQLQKCDECDVYNSDESAWKAIKDNPEKRQILGIPDDYTFWNRSYLINKKS